MIMRWRDLVVVKVVEVAEMVGGGRRAFYRHLRS